MYPFSENVRLCHFISGMAWRCKTQNCTCALDRPTSGSGHSARWKATVYQGRHWNCRVIGVWEDILESVSRTLLAALKSLFAYILRRVDFSAGTSGLWSVLWETVSKASSAGGPSWFGWEWLTWRDSSRLGSDQHSERQNNITESYSSVIEPGLGSLQRY